MILMLIREYLIFYSNILIVSDFNSTINILIHK